MKETVLDTGGPAFAMQVDNRTLIGECHPGMTLLDYFAGQALAGTLANIDGTKWLAEQAAKRGNDASKLLPLACYNIAAAMIAEKRRRENSVKDCEAVV